MQRVGEASTGLETAERIGQGGTVEEDRRGLVRIGEGWGRLEWRVRIGGSWRGLERIGERWRGLDRIEEGRRVLQGAVEFAVPYAANPHHPALFYTVLPFKVPGGNLRPTVTAKSSSEARAYRLLGRGIQARVPDLILMVQDQLKSVPPDLQDKSQSCPVPMLLLMFGPSCCCGGPPNAPTQLSDSWRSTDSCRRETAIGSFFRLVTGTQPSTTLNNPHKPNFPHFSSILPFTARTKFMPGCY